MAGKAGKPKWVVSDWIDVEPDQFWLTVIAAVSYTHLTLPTSDLV